MELVQRQSHRNLPLAATGPRPRVDNAADDVIIVDVDDAPIGRHPSSRRIGMDCSTAPYPSSSARAIGESFCIDALPENTTPAGYGRIPAAVVHAGEAIFDAATRRLDEEMGIICPLSFSFSMSYRPEVSNGLIANEIVHVFAGRLNGTPTPNPIEVSDWYWKTFTEVERDIDERPDIYTVWFRKIRNEFWGDIVGLLYGRGSGGEPKLPTP